MGTKLSFVERGGLKLGAGILCGAVIISVRLLSGCGGPPSSMPGACLHAMIMPTEVTVTQGQPVTLIAGDTDGNAPVGTTVRWEGNHLNQTTGTLAGSDRASARSSNAFLGDAPPGDYVVSAQWDEADGYCRVTAKVHVTAGPDGGTGACPSANGPVIPLIENRNSPFMSMLLYMGNDVDPSRQGIYWSDGGAFGAMGPAPAINHIPIAGSASPEVIVDPQTPGVKGGIGGYLAIAGAKIYWLNDATLWSAPLSLAGVTATRLANFGGVSSAGGVAITGNGTVYFINYSSGLVLTPTADVNVPQTIYSGNNLRGPLAVMNDVYFIEFAKGILDLAGGVSPPKTVVADAASVGTGEAIAMDATSIYWSRQDNGSVYRSNRDGSNVTKIYQRTDRLGDMQSIVEDGAYVYVTYSDPQEGQILKIAKDGSCIAVLADKQHYPYSVKAYMGKVYWVNTGDTGGPGGVYSVRE